MAYNVGWRNFWWLNTAILGFVGICCIFLFPETKYNRSFALKHDAVATAKGVKPGSTEEIERISSTVKESPDNERINSENLAIKEQNGQQSNLSKVQTAQDSWLGSGSPSKAQWKVAQPYEGNLLLELWMPWYLCAFPIVEFSAFVVSWTASSYLTLNLTQSQAFAAPPYNYTSTKIGFFNFAILIGAFIGLFTAGPLSDLIAARLTKRNRGIR